MNVLKMAMKNGDRSIELSRRSTTESTDGSTTPFLEEEDTRVKERVKVHTGDSDYGPTESHQFDQNESEVWWHHQLQR